MTETTTKKGGVIMDAKEQKLIDALTKANRKWDEENRKWDEANRKWDEANRKWDEAHRKLWEYQREQEQKG